MKVILKDGSSKEYENSMAVIDIARDISEGLARVACAAELDGKVVDLRTVVDGEHELNILTFDSEEGKRRGNQTDAGKRRAVQSRTDRRSARRRGNFLLSDGRVRRPVCRPTPDDNQTAESYEIDLILRSVLERQ